jgi:hypothetical protein
MFEGCWQPLRILATLGGFVPSFAQATHVFGGPEAFTVAVQLQQRIVFCPIHTGGCKPWHAVGSNI